MLYLQETWLSESQIPMLSSLSNNFFYAPDLADLMVTKYLPVGLTANLLFYGEVTTKRRLISLILIAGVFALRN
jgi:hypothetical protein